MALDADIALLEKKRKDKDKIDAALALINEIAAGTGRFEVLIKREDGVAFSLTGLVNDLETNGAQQDAARDGIDTGVVAFIGDSLTANTLVNELQVLSQAYADDIAAE